MPGGDALRLVLIAGLVLGLGGCRTTAVPWDGDFAYLHVIPTESDGRSEPSGPLRAELEMSDARGVAGSLDPELVVAVESDRLVIDLARYAGGRPTGRQDYLSPSFVVDHDEAIVSDWVGTIVARWEQTQDVEALEAAVREVIELDMNQGMLFASEILRRRKGDCTEHAILFAALARSLGIPTRIILGTVIVDVEGAGIQAFGHAWDEVFRDDVWSLVDATPLTGGRPLAYVPVLVVENEGPGYTSALLELIGRQPTRVRLVSDAASGGR